MDENSIRQIGGPSDSYSQQDIKLCREGDRKALHKVLMAHSAQLEAILRRTLRGNQDVADALQKTLIAAVQGFSSYRGTSSVRSWLTGIALNVARNQVRNEIRDRSRFSVDTDALDVVPSQEQLPDARAATQETHLRIRHHVGRLAPKLQEAYLLHVIDGFTFRELGEALGVPQMTAKSRVFHAKRQLKDFVRNDPILRNRQDTGMMGGNGE